MGGEISYDEKKSIYENAMRWLFGQGVTTVLLFSMMAGGAYTATVQLPQFVESMNVTHEKISERNAVAIEKMGERCEAGMKKMAEEHGKTMEMILRANP